MKATIDFDPTLYRRLKAEAALRGRTVRELVAEGVQMVLATPMTRASEPVDDRAYFGVLKSYADAAHGVHDMASIRESIARERAAAGRVDPAGTDSARRTRAK